MQWQGEHDSRTAAWAILSVNAALMMGDDALHDGQSKPRALGLGRAERVEEPVLDRRIHAGAW